MDRGNEPLGALLARLDGDSLRALVARCDPGPHIDGLESAWRAARSRMRTLAEREAGLADRAAVLPLPPTMEAAVARFLARHVHEPAFSRVPVAFGMVDVDSLVAVRPLLWQTALDRHADTARAAAGDDGALADMAFPLSSRPPALRSSCDGNTWQVVGEDEALALTHVQVAMAEDGTARLHLVAGRPPAALHVARVEGRLLLIDGAHRARALRTQGHRFVPAMVSACEDRAELASLCPWASRSELEELLDSPRPPMLRDHDRRSLVARLVARRRERRLSMRLSCELSWLP